MSANAISGWQGLSPSEQDSLKEMQDAAAVYNQTHPDMTKFIQPQQGGMAGDQMAAIDPNELVPVNPPAKTNSGALHFEGQWVKNKDGSLRFVRTNEWREQ